MLHLDSKSTARRGFSRAKSAAPLSDALSRRLNAYALAAGAAGVAVLACSTPAEAAPVCKTVGAQLTRTSTFPLYLIDPAIPAFNIAQGTNATFRSGTLTGIGTIFWWNRGFFTPNTAGANVLLDNNRLPADVAAGAEIGPGGNFGKGTSYGLLFTYGKGQLSFTGGGTKLRHEGNLNLTQNNYIGLQFTEAGAVHYGWARLAITFQDGGSDVKHAVTNILGFGYESTPNAAIDAGSCGAGEQVSTDTPDPSSASGGASLGTLALGSAGIANWKTAR
ncbi:MAG TPA: hypothetical protein VGZ91_07125 [Candidatus Sulfotelmatobacter sp.]|jgi:hypothetical protein|nr:hypothetical protein [Candidatus Sulfotelmatobacter sp.]